MLLGTRMADNFAIYDQYLSFYFIKRWPQWEDKYGSANLGGLK